MNELPIVPYQSNAELGFVDPSFLPTIITDAGDRAARRFVEFFTANIPNDNTRAAYGRATARFLHWCEQRGLRLEDVSPPLIAGYVRDLHQAMSTPTVKQHLAAIKMMFDYFVTGAVLEHNPATSVRGPKHVIHKGKTPVMEGQQAALLLDSIDTNKPSGLRDRALIGVMVYSFARISAVLDMNFEDYRPHGTGRTMILRLHEKGGKYHEIPVHHKAEGSLEEYIQGVGMGDDKKAPLFQSVDRSGQLTGSRFRRTKAWEMVRRRCRQAGLGDHFCNHTFRATGITVYLSNDGKLEKPPPQCTSNTNLFWLTGASYNLC